MVAVTDAERKQLERDRRKAGLVRIDAWVPADKADAVMDAIKKASNNG